MANELWSEAVQEWKRAIELFPEHSPSLDRYAWSLVTVPLEHRDVGTALASVRKAMALRENQMYWGTYAAVLAEAGEWIEAIDCAERDRADRGDQEAIASLFVLARCYAKLDDLDSAEPLLKLAQKLYEEVKDTMLVGVKKELEHLHREAERAFH
jgi:tetratricopeptide (TPR) repeat protein